MILTIVLIAYVHTRCVPLHYYDHYIIHVTNRIMFPCFHFVFFIARSNALPKQYANRNENKNKQSYIHQSTTITHEIMHKIIHIKNKNKKIHTHTRKNEFTNSCECTMPNHQ